MDTYYDVWDKEQELIVGTHIQLAGREGKIRDSNNGLYRIAWIDGQEDNLYLKRFPFFAVRTPTITKRAAQKIKDWLTLRKENIDYAELLDKLDSMTEND